MESVPDTFPALFYGYSVIWGILVVYLCRMWAKLRKLEKQVGTLMLSDAHSKK